MGSLSRPKLDLAEPGNSELTPGSLYQRVLLARVWLPITIVGVVLLYQLTIVPLGGAIWRFWSELLFYGILGPAATFVTLTWIASEVKRREAAQIKLEQLFKELQESHSLLGAIQHVTEQFASAPDLETALSAASVGVTRVTGAEGAALFLGGSAGSDRHLSVTQQHGLSANLLRDAEARAVKLSRGEGLGETVSLDRRYWVLSNRFQIGGRSQGSLHAYYQSEPSGEQRESFNILANEFSAVAEAAQGRTRDLVALVEVDRSMRAEGNLERLLETLLERMMERADASLGGVYLADEAHILHLKVCQGTPSHARSAVQIGEGFVGAVAEEREASVTGQLVTEERSGPVLSGANSAVALPLLAEDELLGVVVLGHEAAMHFETDTLPFLNLVAGQVSLAVHNARAYLQSEELAIAEERARIAREIHDGVAQSLAFSALKLDLVSRLNRSDPVKAEAELDATRVLLREMIKEVRRSIFALRPIDLERHGFSETVRRYCSDYGQQNGVTVDVELSELPQLGVKSEAVLFRIFQEAMHNVAKHSSAENVSVELGTCNSGQAYVSVRDDGVGFDPDAVGERVTTAGGLGLRQMQERIEARGGVFKLESGPEQGTAVFASVPQ